MGNQLLTVAALAVLALAGWFLLAGAPIVAAAFGAFAGVVLATRLVPGIASARGGSAIGLAAAFLLFGLVIVWMTRSELSYMDLGEISSRVDGVAYAVAGLFAGTALRTIWSAMNRTNQG